MHLLLAMFLATTLSSETLQAYRNGSGNGMAMPAETNGYPGPRHVLDLADQLQLSVDQRTRMQSIYDSMHTEAVRLGADIIALETKLDRGFAEKTMTTASLDALTKRIAAEQGTLRAVHLKAHLAAKEVLTSEQIDKYMMLRGHHHHHQP